MKKNEIQERFLDLIEQSLSKDEERELLAELEKDPELANAFKAYEKVVFLEQAIASEEYKPGPQFAVKVMDRIEDDSVGFLEMLFMSWKRNRRVVTSSLAFTATLMLVFLLSKKVPTEDYRLSTPVVGAKRVAVDQVTTQAEQSAADQDRAVKPEAQVPSSSSIASAPAEEKEEEKSPAFANQIAIDRMAEVRENLNKDSAPAEKMKSDVGKPQRNEEVLNQKAAGVVSESLQNVPAPAKKEIEGKDRGKQVVDSRPNDKKAQSVMMDEIAPSVSSRSSGVAADDLRGNIPSGNPSDGAGELAARARDLLGSEYRSRRQAPEPKRAPQSVEAVVSTNSLPKGGRVGRGDEGFAAGAIAPAPEPQQRVRIAPLPPPPMPVLQVTESDSYKSYEEQPRIRTSEEALSTFSVDVDTASYTNARRYLQAGNLPPPSSVRIEEFINYFDYDYPNQTEKPFSFSYEIAPSPLENDRLLLKVGIKARDAKVERKPWNLVFLVDTSGSMSPADRLGLIQKGLQAMVSEMKPEDKVAIVTYAGSAGLVLDSTPAKESAKILSAIRNLSSGGSTNGSGGIELAYQVAERNMISNGVNRVVLATDGDFNVGVTSESELNSLIEKKRKSGITLTTLGVGTGNFKDARLEQLADKGNGNYFYLDSFQEARRVLVDKIGSTVEVVAKDVKLQIEFNPQHVSQYRLIGYDNRKLAKEDFNNDAIDAGEIGVGHTVTAIYEVILNNTELSKKLDTEYRYQKKSIPTEQNASEMPQEMAFLKIRYKEPQASTSQLLEFPIAVSQIKGSADAASNDFRFASAVAYFGTLLRESKFIGNYGYHEVVQLAAASLGEDKDGSRREFLNLVKNAEASAKVGPSSRGDTED